jgi:uncharacterized protein (TIGR02594 family)
MSTISRQQFVQALGGSSIDLDQVSDDLKSALTAAGVSEQELRALAGRDGIISGKPELTRLFGLLDDFDRDGSRRTLVARDDQGLTQAGELMLELAAEADRQRLSTHLRSQGAAPVQTGGAAGGSPAPWLDVARQEVGQKEVAGKAHNPRIVEYHQSTSLKATSDETPWCSSFVNWTMKQAGYPGTNSAAALSWKKWGEKSDEPVVGSIAVIDRGNGKGHVGIVVGRDGDNIILLGGNQKDGVRYSAYPASKIAEYRVPPGYVPPEPRLPEMKVGELPLTWQQTR